MSEKTFPSGKLLEMLRQSALRGSQVHSQFLRSRQESLRGLRALIEMQIAGSMPVPGSLVVEDQPAHRPAVFDRWQLDEFGRGQISRCLGPAFARYDQRRIPRIPNGDLRMMDRITAISGSPRDFHHPASIEAEYDVPVDAWYLRDSAYPEIPTSLFMEIALQPCGFLSAYLDTYSFVPYEVIFFRNLDGSLRSGEPFDLRGKIIITRARLINSVVSGGTVIQRFGFELTCEGRFVCSGESTFGYFSPETMANQVGLDGGRQVLPWVRASAGRLQAARTVVIQPLQETDPGKPLYRIGTGRMHYLDECKIDPLGGTNGKGYVYACRPVNPQDWFFPFHFFQDPVMPGSLGVEAILEAIQAYAIDQSLGSKLRSPRIRTVPGTTPMTWRYRGQITPQHSLMELEAHLNEIRYEQGRVAISADASLWVDGLRIYELKNASVDIFEG